MTELETYAVLMERRRAILEQLESLDAEIAETKSVIEEDVRKQGDSYGYGYHAGFKPGRKSTNHEAAATWANVPKEIVDKFTTTKISVAWAKVTKEAKVDVTNFTTVGEPVFFIAEVDA